ncbi:MAG: hypothetical protein QW584_01445 [Thermofilaceae archaeon]
MKAGSLLPADHLGLLEAIKQGTLSKLPSKAVVHGNPDRVEIHASYLREPRLVARKRGFVSYVGYYDGELVLITSSGMGAGSASIAFEELIELGVNTIIRVGTCGSYRSYIKPGDLIIPTEVLLESPVLRYIFPDYLRKRNSLANVDWLHYKEELIFVKGFKSIYTLISEFVEKTLRLNKWNYEHRYYTGPIHDKDILHAWRSEYSLNPMELHEIKANVRKHTIGTDMETGSLFVIAHMRGAQAGAILVVVDFNADNETMKAQDEAMNVAYIASLAVMKKLGPS